MALEMVLHERRVWFLHLRLTFYAWLGYVELIKKRSASPFVFWLFSAGLAPETWDKLSSEQHLNEPEVFAS